MNVFTSIFYALKDLAVRELPFRKKNERSFAFLAHPRDLNDVYRRYPFAGHFPKKIVLSALKKFWPTVLSEIGGLKSLETGQNIRGYIIAVPLTAEQMLENRELAKKKIIQAVKLAGKLGVSITGLGAFTSSVTGGGREIIGNAETFITNGNSFTAGITALDVERIMKKSKKLLNVAVVGATGSIGGAVSKILASKNNFKSLVLVGRTPENIEKLKNEIRKINDSNKIKTAGDIKEISKCDIVIVATSAKGAVLRPEYLKRNAVVYDVTQPKNTPKEVIKNRKDVKFIDGGLARAEDIDCHFNFGLPKGAVFSCLAETMLLAAENASGHFSIGDIEPEKIKKILNLAEKYNFYPYGLF